MECSETNEPRVKGKGKGKGKSSNRPGPSSAPEEMKEIQKNIEEFVITSECSQDEDSAVVMTEHDASRHSFEFKPIDLSNTFPQDVPAGRFSVIMCTKNRKPTPVQFIGDEAKSIDNAKKVLFPAESNIQPKCNTEKLYSMWNGWSLHDEIGASVTIGAETNGCEQIESQNSTPDKNKINRKRLTPRSQYNFMKKARFDSNSIDLDVSRIMETDTTPQPPDLSVWLEKYENWSNLEKNIAINSLINRSTIMQVRHMMKTIEPLFQTDFISLLPKEIALMILSELAPKDLSRVSQTCRYWRYLANDNLLWKKHCLESGIMMEDFPFDTVAPLGHYKWEYANQKTIERNWRTKPATEAIIMKGHDDHVITCLQCYGNKIVSGSDDTTLKVWSTLTGDCLQNLIGHAGGVWSCQMVDDMVVSGSTDRTLRVWDAVTGKCTSVLGGHTSTVRCMRLFDNKVVSGSRDATLRVWQLPEGRCLNILVGHMAAVRCVQYNGKLVVSGAYDFCVKVWNPDTGECLHTLTGHTNRVYTLKFDGIHIVSGSLDTSIRVWDAETGQLKHTLLGHSSLITSMELQNNILVSGNADATLKVWDLNTGQCLHTLSGTKKHHLSVTYVQLLKRYVVSSSDDGTVKLWDLSNGEFIRNIVQLPSGGAGGNVLRIRATNTQLVCAVGSRNGTEETKLMLMKFDTPGYSKSFFSDRWAFNQM